MNPNRKAGAMIVVFLFLYAVPIRNTGELQITADRSEQSHPAIYGDIVVWDDYRNGNWDIYGYNLSTKQEFQITTAPRNQLHPAIYGDIVVWHDKRDIERGYIYGCSLSTGKEFQIKEARTYSSYNAYPAIHKNIIVWQDDRNNNWDIHGYDLYTRTKFSITIKGDQKRPAIFEDIVIWQDNRDGNWDIYQYNISTKKILPITTNKRDQKIPAIYGDIVVWRDDINGNWDIYGYNLSTKQDFQITTAPGDQLHPAIYGDIVVWTDNRNGNWDIYGYNLSTRQEFQVTTDRSNQIHPEIYEDIVVWNDKRNTSPDIYRYNLSTIGRWKEKIKIKTILLIGLPICGIILTFFFIFKSKKKESLEPQNTEIPPKKSEKKEFIASYRVKSVFFAKEKIYLNHKGIHIPRYLLHDIDVSYAEITECNYFQDRKSDTCTIKYLNKKGKHKKIKFHSCFDDPIGALKTCFSILSISRKRGYNIKKQLDKNFLKLMLLLEDMGTNPELIELESIDLKVSGSQWKRKLGALKLNNSNVQLIEVVESGYGEVKVEYRTHTEHRSTVSGNVSSYSYQTKHEELIFHPQYHLDFMTNAEPIPLIKSYGKPREVSNRGMIGCGIGMILLSLFLVFGYIYFNFFNLESCCMTVILSGLVGILLLSHGLKSKKVIEYTWSGGKFAERLVQDNELTEMLKKANAPAIEILRNHIKVEDTKIPNKRFFWCVERISGHICRMKEIYCPDCGEKLLSDSKFCHRCGHALHDKRLVRKKANQNEMEKDKINKDINIVSYKLGLITAIYCVNLVNFAVRKDIQAKKPVEESMSLFQDALRALGINITLPDLNHKTQITAFFRSDLLNSILLIRKRLDKLYSKRVGTIFIFSNSIAGYLLAYDYKETVEKIESLKKATRQLGHELNIRNGLINNFFIEPNEYFDEIVENMLHTPFDVIDVFDVEFAIDSVVINLGKATELIKRYLK